MAKELVIVESPAKAKTIEKYLGEKFVVRSSYGHVRDLAKKGLAVDVDKDFAPSYAISPEKEKVVKELKSLAKKAPTVWLATDEDREGEAISWHLKEALGLDDSNTRRITFNEITKTAIQDAIKNPRQIHQGLVNAQQARRVLDRLVGFELSPILWKKVKPSLSAGRVQSVSVRLIVEREREILGHTATSAFKVVANFDVGGKEMRAELPKRFKTEDEAMAFLEDCKEASFSVANVETKPAKRTPAAPFTTSTLQQEASRKLSFSVAQTMRVAQSLYESGKITYMRTDSVNLSQLAVNTARSTINNKYGEEYAQTRNFTTKSKGAQEAHEAIRPTDLNLDQANGDNNEQRLYELIWKRTIASQMADAQLERTTATIAISTREEHLVAKGEVIKFDGFLKVYLEGRDDEEENEDRSLLPPIKPGDTLPLNGIDATERFERHPARYTEASLVKKLEELGIGRPSTYAPTISTIQKRGYVVKEDREGKQRAYRELQLRDKQINAETKSENAGAERAKLFPTDIGMVVNDFLLDNFADIMDYNFTAGVEKEFDEIAEGTVVWTDMIRRFYKPFHAEVEKTLETSERATGERYLGEHPEDGKKMIARIGRYGPMIQIGETDSDEKPRFASLRKDQSISTITMEEALDLFKLPRTLGTYENKEVSTNIGRFGPYVRHDGKFVSLKVKEGDDPMTIELDRAIELIEAKRKADREKLIKAFEEDDNVQVLNGRYGPYIKFGRQNVRIPKGTEPASLTYEQCVALAEEDKKKPKKRGRK